MPVIFDVPEIDTLTRMSRTPDSVLLPTLKSFAMGEQLGQANATKDARRIVPAHSYRGCLSVGVQPGHASVIFGDATGGTPQRFVWTPVIDPDTPAGRFSDPEPLEMDTAWLPAGDEVVEVVYSFPDIERSIVENRLARVRGEGGALDGHALLTRCKVASLLAIMHGRIEVTEWDWSMSAVVMAVSDRTRTELQQKESQARADAHRERGKNDEFRREGRERYELDSVKSSVVALLKKRGGDASHSELNSAMGKANRRKLLPPALDELADEGKVRAIPVTGGTRYELIGAVQGEHPVQGALGQAGGDEQPVQGERRGNVISLENRSSRKHTVSCRQWFDQYFAERIEAGCETVEAFAGRQAAQAAGYNRNQIGVELSRRGLKGKVWLLTA